MGFGSTTLGSFWNVPAVACLCFLRDFGLRLFGIVLTVLTIAGIG